MPVELPPWTERLEDVGTLSKSGVHTDTCCLASIAISLKRIADALHGEPGVQDGILQAVQAWDARNHR